MRTSGGRDLQARLTALVGLAVVVGVAVAALFFAGILGNQGGGTTESGIKIQNAIVMDPPPAPGLGDLDVEPRVGSLAPDFEVSTFEGDRVRLSDFRGRPVYVNYWATWCVPCRVEMPDIFELLQRHGGPDGLAVISINRGEPLGRAEGFLESIERSDGTRGVGFTVNALDPDDSVYRAYRGLGMPLSVFIDRGGIVRVVHNGLMRLPDLEDALAEADPTEPNDS